MSGTVSLMPAIGRRPVGDHFSHMENRLKIGRLLKNNIFGFSVVFSRKIVKTSIFKVEYLENGLADFNDFGLILQDFGRPFR